MSLIVLNASAGSGKTYNLVITYLKLILDSTKDMNAFSEVMAMTFTNKAAFEMKDRIISYLDNISRISELDNQTYTKTDAICRQLASDLNIEIPIVIQRSKNALKVKCVVNFFKYVSTLTECDSGRIILF